MKRILGYAILGVIGYYLWRNHFKRLFQPKDQVKEILEEVQTKNEIGDNKRAVFLANQVPTSTIGDTPYAGTPLTAFTAEILRQPKDLQLLPKGGNTSKNPFDRVVSWLNVIVLLVTLASAGSVNAAVPMLGSLATNGLGNGEWVFYDDFNKPVSKPGVMPDSPTGHRYGIIANPVANTNGLTVANGRWWQSQAGAIYLSISNGVLNGGGFSQGTSRRWNKFAGQVRWENLSGANNGVIRGLGFILSSNADFVGKSPMYLHCGFDPHQLYVQRELSSTNLISETLPAGPFGATYFVYGTNVNFAVSIVSNTITIDYAGYRFQKTDPSLGMYAQMNVLTIECQGVPTVDQIFGKWESIAAGFGDGSDQWNYGGPFEVGDTNFSLKGLKLERGGTSAMNGRVGLASGLATIATTQVQADSLIIVSAVATNNPLSAVSATNIVPGTSFQIRSASNTDGNSVDWMIIKRALP